MPNEDDSGLAIGQRVRLTGDPTATGEIVEDFGSLAGTEVKLDRTTAVRSRRWAVTLDDGRLEFVDDGEIELLS